MSILNIAEPQQPRIRVEPVVGWSHFISMPHQPMFTLGAMQAVLVVLWWLIDLSGRYGNWYPAIQWTIPATWAHLYLMVFCLFTPYIFGFLMTTYPRWMDGVEVSRKHYLPSAALLAGGSLLGYAGLVLGKPLLLLAVATYAAGWAVGLYALLKVYVGAKRPDIMHARVTSGMLAIGLTLLLVYLLGIGLNSSVLVSIARSGGIWWFLFPVFFAVSHRMIPFFSGAVLKNYTVIRPEWAVKVMTFAAMTHGALEVANQPQWTWLVDIPMAAIAFWLTYQWRFRQSFKVRILAMLHVAFIWVGIALTLFAVQSLALLMEIGSWLGRGPLHALMVGYFASMLVAMSTRVTLGHSGQPLVADQRAWAIFVTIQLVTLARVFADVPGAQSYSAVFYLLSAALWLVAFSSWLYKFHPLFLNVNKP